jgi:hypothetical protein
MSEILDTSSSLATVERAIKLVEQLRAEGLPAVAAIRPLASFTAAQRDFLQKRLRFVADQHVDAVVLVQASEVRLWLSIACASVCEFVSACLVPVLLFMHSAYQLQAGVQAAAGPDCMRSCTVLQPTREIEISSRPGGAAKPLQAHSVDTDMHDPASACTISHLAHLDLLRDLAGFFTSELRLLSEVSASEELAASYRASLQQDAWRASVKEIRGVLAEVRRQP